MQKTRQSCTIQAGACLLLFLACAAGIAKADTITLCADAWCPYNCEPGSDAPGYMIEIAAKVFGKAGHVVDYRQMPWTRALVEARSGKVNAVVGAGIGDTPDFIFPENSLGTMNNTFWIRKGDTWRFSGIDSLKKVRLGVIQDYDYSKLVTEYIRDNKDSDQVQLLTTDTALEQNLKKLLAKRIDVIVEDENVLRNKAREMGVSDKIVQAGFCEKVAERQKLYIAFSPTHQKSKEYAQLLSSGIATLRDSGELAAILVKYGLGDWETPEAEPASKE
jgi:polar amino acid transport system substrate-binding protein